MTARISIRDEPSISLPLREEVEQLLALTTPPPSPLTPLSSPLPHIPSPLLLASPPTSVLPVLPLPTSSPPLQLLSSDRRADRPKITLPPQKRLGINLSLRCEVGESLAATAARPIGGRRADYGFFDTMDAEISRQTQIYQKVKTLVDDSQYHYETARLLDQEALVSWEAAGHRSQTVASEMLQADRMRQAEIAALRTFDCVNAALAARDANRAGDDSHTSGTGVRRTERVTRECTYQDFMKCQSLYFKGTEGVVKLTQWFERMETVFRITNCSVENQIKFSTCTLLAGALTWLNSYVKIVGHDAAYVMTWTELKKKMADKYCPRNEMKKLEAELWNLEVQGTDVTWYNQRFQVLALLCVRIFPEESDKVERYVGVLANMILGSVVASKPKTMQEATEMATELMDKKIHTFVERQAIKKRKFKDTS
ncbi:reverse transcriptase domain-containing protein [Tanacetum coccineum]